VTDVAGLPSQPLLTCTGQGSEDSDKLARQRRRQVSDTGQQIQAAPMTHRRDFYTIVGTPAMSHFRISCHQPCRIVHGGAVATKSRS
jgi:hypothetical protein